MKKQQVKIKILPFGDVITDSFTYYFKKSDALRIVSKHKKNNVSLPVDINHALLKDCNASLAGWTNSYVIDTDGLYAVCNINAKVYESLVRKKYRYVSPVIILNESNCIIDIHSIALTNTPGIKNLKEISLEEVIKQEDMKFTKEKNINQDDKELTYSIFIKELMKKLGLTDKSTKEDILKAISTIINTQEKKENELNKATKAVPLSSYYNIVCEAEKEIKIKNEVERLLGL